MAKEGTVEREIALEMEFFMKRNGAEVIGFDIIVASGKTFCPSPWKGERETG